MLQETKFLMFLFNKLVKYNVALIVFLICVYPINNALSKESIIPINLDSLPKLSPQKIALGKKLFEEKRLSSSGLLSCAVCHPIDKFTVDGLSFSFGSDGKPLAYNTPSINYASLNHYLGWTGNTDDLKQNLELIIHKAKLMNTTWPDIISRIQSVEEYEVQFTQAGYEEINIDSISNALITFEKSLVTPSRFDLYLLGEKTQLSKSEINGYQLFKEYGCVSCHQGINIGGNMRQTFGVMNPYYDLKDNPKYRDLGYFNITQQKEDMFLFRVPSLRNVAQTAPYFHDASAKTLKQAIEIMFKVQLGLIPSEADVQAIESFLRALDGL